MKMNTTELRDIIIAFVLLLFLLTASFSSAESGPAVKSTVSASIQTQAPLKDSQI